MLAGLWLRGGEYGGGGRGEPVESGELNWWPLSGPGPGIGDGSHSCGLYGWIALNGVGAL